MGESASSFQTPAQPGNGAFLASQSQPQPGDGAYLAKRPNGPSAPRHGRDESARGQRGESSMGRGGRIPGRGRFNGSSNGGSGQRSNDAGSGSGQRSNGHSNFHQNGISNGASNQQRSRPPPPHFNPSNAVSTSRQPTSPRIPNKGQMSQISQPSSTAQIEQAVLDPAAQPFTPGTVVSVADLDQSDDTASKKSSKKKKNGQEKDKKKNESPTNAPALAPAHLGRRAAFQQSTKLTKTSSRTSSEGTGAKITATSTEAKFARVKTKKSEPDDHVSRLTRALKNRPFLECPICFNSITPSQPTWCCLPPDHPPAPKPNGIASGLATPNPITGSTSSSDHYSACYTPFHLDCIRSWANRSLVEEEDRARQAGRDGEEVAWRCPGCQKRRADRVGGYRCFCGRLSHPPTLTSAPHSCGDSCARKRPNCSHSCPLPCHPGPCPPCQVALIVPCPSHHTPLTVKCSAATSNNAALSPVCDEPCSKQLDCGNKDHECQSLCHYGDCKPCDQREQAKCYCGAESKDVECGWGRKNEKICAALTEDGEDVWWGKYDCGRECDRLYDCGIHPCKQTCHPHPIHPLQCPHSPSIITHCPCGATPLSSLPGYPRPDCLATIPTCGSKCPKARPCGHPCPRKCHTGECPPCHEEVVKTCRCGQSQLLVPCDELREKAENGVTEVTCERVCHALRNCGRHECGKMCCPLWEQAKFRKQRRNDDHDLYPDDDLHKCHLTCGKLLSCGLHTCPKPDHKGPCGRCLQASYDELICNCGETVVYPPVACGTTINCPYPCMRPPPACGHPKTQHACHEQSDCPPCPYLTTKACACGKDLSVKNVRCSQEKVSCGQACGELLGCGYHRCNKPCHRPGECEGCTQVCGKPKKICKHPCTSTCHAPARCSENDPCQTIVTQTCSCGHLQSRTSCGASTSNLKSREKELLKCNSECAVRQRNARLADALGISKPSERNQEVYEDDLKSFAIANYGFVKTVEKTFEEFIKGSRQSTILPHMPVTKRTFVMSLADHYHLTKELIDQEPNRSVQIRRRVDTRSPNPLLSTVAQPPTSTTGTTGGSKLVTSAWGRSTTSNGNVNGTAASVLAGNTKSSGSGWGGATGSARPSRSTTPAPQTTTTQERAVSVPSVTAVRKSNGNGNDNGSRNADGDDWDVDL